MALQTLTVDDIARYCRVSQFTVQKWVQEGRLRAFRTQSGKFLVPVREFQSFLRIRGIPVDGLYFQTGGTAKRVLVISSDDELVEFLVRCLCESSTAVQIFSARNWYEASCQAKTVNPDLVILGPRQADPSEIEAYRRLKPPGGWGPTRLMAIVEADFGPHLFPALRGAADCIMQEPLEPSAVRRQVYGLLTNAEAAVPV